MTLTSLFRSRRDSEHHPSHEDVVPPAPDAPEQPRLRGIIGYYNAFDDGSNSSQNDDELPQRSSHGPAPEEPPSPTQLDDVDVLPNYSCPVSKAGAVGVKVEKVNPFDFLPQPSWFEAYAVLRGTMLNIHHVKQSGFLSHKDRASEHAGRLVKSYTLQHAEAGLAADHKKIEMVPKNPLTGMLSETSLKHLQETEPHLFEARHVYVIRLRLETDQLLLRFRTSEARASWLNAICSAMDLAPAIDERSEPRYQTLPRRTRRRREPRVEQLQTVDFNVLSFVEEQDRIMREQFPHLLQPGNTMSVVSPMEGDHDNAFPNVTTPIGDADMHDIDNDLVRTATNPGVARYQQLSTMLNTVNNMFDPTLNPYAYTGSSTQLPSYGDPMFDPDINPETGKWSPITVVDPVREARCARRCMPTLLYNSKRANRFIISHGRRMQIDWDNQKLIPYTSEPPAYSPDESVPPPPMRAPPVPQRQQSSLDNSRDSRDVEHLSTFPAESPSYELSRSATVDDNRFSRVSMLVTPQQSISELPRPTTAIPRRGSRWNLHSRDQHHTHAHAHNNDDATSGSSGDDTIPATPTSKKESWTNKIKSITRKASRPSLTRHRSTAGLNISHKTIDDEQDAVPELPSNTGFVGRRVPLRNGGIRPFSSVGFNDSPVMRHVEQF